MSEQLPRWPDGLAPVLHPQPLPEPLDLDGFRLGWVVGMIEGEGSFSRSKSRTEDRRGFPRVEMISTDLDNVERMQRYAGGKVNGPYVGTGMGKKPHYRWRLSRQADVLALFALIRPYLSERRQAQIDHASLPCDERPGVFSRP